MNAIFILDVFTVFYFTWESMSKLHEKCITLLLVKFQITENSLITHLHRFYYDELFIILIFFLLYFVILYLCFYIIGYSVIRTYEKHLWMWIATSQVSDSFSGTLLGMCSSTDRDQFCLWESISLMEINFACLTCHQFYLNFT